MLMAHDVLSSRDESLEVINPDEFKRRINEAEESFYECEHNLFPAEYADDGLRCSKVDNFYVNYEDGDIPVGYRFKPTDEQLLVYLNCKTKSETLPNKEIEDTDAHTLFTRHPKELVSNLCDKREWYFYVRYDDQELYNKITRGMTRDGLSYHWRREEQYTLHDVIIGDVVGYKTIFRLFRKSKKTHWKLEEYCVNYDFDTTDTNSNWTLARIIRGVEYGGTSIC